MFVSKGGEKIPELNLLARGEMLVNSFCEWSTGSSNVKHASLPA